MSVVISTRHLPVDLHWTANNCIMTQIPSMKLVRILGTDMTQHSNPDVKMNGPDLSEGGG